MKKHFTQIRIPEEKLQLETDIDIGTYVEQSTTDANSTV